MKPSISADVFIPYCIEYNWDMDADFEFPEFDHRFVDLWNHLFTTYHDGDLGTLEKILKNDGVKVDFVWDTYFRGMLFESKGEKLRFLIKYA